MKAFCNPASNLPKFDRLLSIRRVHIIRPMLSLDALRATVSSTMIIASRQWRRRSHGVLAGYHVSEACATPLLIAGRLGEAVRQVTLAELIGIEGPSLVRLLDQLCAANLVVRSEDPNDRRAKTIALTDEGRSVTAKIEKELASLRADVLKGISREDLEATLRVLDAFRLSNTDGGGKTLDPDGDA